MKDGASKTTPRFHRLIKFRLSSLIWLLIVVAAFFAGLNLGNRGSDSTFNRHGKVTIAIAGLLDVDGDGRDDRDRLIKMIHKNGGRVVAAETENEVIGKIDSSTRFLVRGQMSETFRANSKLLVDATNAGVQSISPGELLKWMGYADGTKRKKEKMSPFQSRVPAFH